MDIEFESFRLIGRDTWLAQVALSLPEQLPNRGVAQVCTMRLRFTANTDATAGDLHRLTYSETKRVLSAALAALEQQSPEGALEALFAQDDEWHPRPSGEPSDSRNE